jgi:tetratricopeptide (TPR) repeat protein
MNPLVANSPA